MVQIDISLSAAVGATLAAAARVQLRSEAQLTQNRWVGSSTAFTGVFVVPALLYFLEAFPSWDTMYFWDRPPPWVAPVCAAAVMVASRFGFMAVHALVRRGRERAALVLPGLFLLQPLVVMAVWHDRFLHVGSGATFAAGAEANLLDSPLPLTMALVIGLWVGLPLAVVLVRWSRPSVAEWRDRRRAVSGLGAARG